jgi:hypothetical protein
MKSIITLSILFAFFLLSCNNGETKKSAITEKDTKPKIKVFFLAGQSNMDGRARAYKLTDEDRARLQKAQKNVTLYYNHQKPVPLQPFTASDFLRKKFDAEKLFGPELFFGINMSEAYPDEQIVLIKRSRGAMSLYGAWNPEWTEEKARMMKEDDDPKLYRDFIQYADSILKSLDSTQYEICGMLWVQGEADSNKKKHGSTPAQYYEENLRKLIKGVRKEFNKPQLPFIMLQVGNGKVVEGMKHIAAEDEYVSLIPQESDTNSVWYFERNPRPIGHYKYESMKKIGKYFFDFYQKDYADQSPENNEHSK